jgi:hypothetical protein
MVSGRRMLGVAALIAGSAAFLAAISGDRRRSGPTVSREALVSGFDAATRNLVYRWDHADPRPTWERRAALFEFVHQTYGTTVRDKVGLVR